MAIPDLDHLIAAVSADALSDDPLSRLAAAARARDDLDHLAEALLDHFVEHARDAGCSWSQIGNALGVSKQAAQQRHTTTESVARRLLARLPGRARQGRRPLFFDRMTDRARSSIVLAQDEARMLDHNYIGTEHLLLGLMRVEDGLAVKALGAMGIRIDGLRSQVTDIVGCGHAAPAGHIPFTPRAKKVLELSLRESLQLGHNYVGTEHILLGLLREGQGVAAQVLQRSGADPAEIRKRVLSMLDTTA
jgi:hypothetical protein